jgi:hypothetical protein
LSTLSIDLRACAADTSRVFAVAALAAPFDRDVDAALAGIAHCAGSAPVSKARGCSCSRESALAGTLREPGPDEMAPDVPPGSRPRPGRRSRA